VRHACGAVLAVACPTADQLAGCIAAGVARLGLCVRGLIFSSESRRPPPADMAELLVPLGRLLASGFDVICVVPRRTAATLIQPLRQLASTLRLCGCCRSVATYALVFCCSSAQGAVSFDPALSADPSCLWRRAVRNGSVEQGPACAFVHGAHSAAIDSRCLWLARDVRAVRASLGAFRGAYCRAGVRSHRRHC